MKIIITNENMTPANKGIVAIVAGVFSLLIQNSFTPIGGNLISSFLPSHGYGALIFFIISLFCFPMAIYLGIQARKGNAKIVGLIGIVLGIIGAVLLSTQILVATALWGSQ